MLLTFPLEVLILKKNLKMLVPGDWTSQELDVDPGDGRVFIFEKVLSPEWHLQVTIAENKESSPSLSAAWVDYNGNMRKLLRTKNYTKLMKHVSLLTTGSYARYTEMENLLI